MWLKNVYRENVIQCINYNNGDIFKYKLCSGKTISRYGKFDQIVRKDVVLIKIVDDLYVDLEVLYCNNNNLNSFAVLSTRAYGENTYYVDMDSLKEYECFCNTGCKTK